MSEPLVIELDEVFLYRMTPEQEKLVALAFQRAAEREARAMMTGVRWLEDEQR